MKVSDHILEREITNLVLDMGIDPSTKGYPYVKEGIRIVYKNPKMIYSMTTKLYPAIGEKYSISDRSVERTFRYSVTKMKNKSDPDTIEKFFHNTAYINGDICIPNKLFLSVAVANLEYRLKEKSV